MKRKHFLKHVGAAATGAALVPAGFASNSMKPEAETREVYELRAYTVRNKGALATYLEEAYLPALNKYGIKRVGVFSEMGMSQPAKLYVLIPYPSAAAAFEIPQKVAADADYLKASEGFHKLPSSKKVYDRFSTSMLSAFAAIPQMEVPIKGDRIFELRTYEGHNVDAVKRKVKMFNEQELPVFYKVGLHPVFFGEIIAGEHMPALTYMIAFKDMEEHDKNWDAFRIDPDWERMKALPEFADTVSRIHRTFLVPETYSQV